MSYKMTNGCTITVVSTGKSYHTLKDLGLAMGNNNPIGPPVVETAYVDVPGADGFLDYSEALAGRPIYKEREITMELGGKRPRDTWAGYISYLRVLFHGKRVKLVFDDFPGYYWQGRAEVSDFDRFREVGTLSISIPKADPFAYSVDDNSSRWLWDPFDFEIGVIDEPINLVLANSENSVTIQHGPVPFVLHVDVATIGDTGLSMEANGDKYLLQLGYNELAEVVVSDTEDLTVTFKGTGSLSVTYRRRTL